MTPADVCDHIAAHADHLAARITRHARHPEVLAHIARTEVVALRVLAAELRKVEK